MKNRMIENTRNIRRGYDKPLRIDPDDCFWTADEWEDHIVDKICYNDHGCGYWVKDNLVSEDEVFSTPRLDATHVVWYNK